MQYIELKNNLKDFLIISNRDFKKEDPGFHVQRLTDWQDKGYIKKVTRGYYVFSDTEINDSVLHIIANEIYNPSYVSLESAFSYYNLIPEGVYSVTSVSSKKTIVLKTPFADFNYKKIKPELMFGYKLVDYRGHKFKMAEIEKAVLDYFYINAKIKSDNDFFEMRFNASAFKESADMEKFYRYLKAFSNKSLEKRIKKFLKFINNANNRTN
jgi:predicted transcriptional regulator of viral defense system